MMQKKNNNIIWGVLLGAFIFQGVLEKMIPFVKYFDECVALLCFPLAIYDCSRRKNREIGISVKYRRAEFVLILLFLGCGFWGSFVNRFQPVLVTLMSAVLGTKFFMILLTAGYLQKYFPIYLEEQEGTVEGLSLAWFGYFLLANLFPEYLFVPEAWDICAKSSILFALLIFCRHEKIWLYRSGLLLMSLMLVLSGKEKAYAGVLIFVVLYYLIVHKKVQAKIRYILYMAVPVVLLAWDKIYYYFILGNDRFAKSIMTKTSIQIMKDYFPFGTGFGTFGSTYAREFYSPVYYLYGISENAEMGIQNKQYLTDMFWPILFGETGILGTLVYVGLLILLFLQIQRVFYYSKKKYFILLYLFVYMLITTFSEAGFMQPAVMVIAFVMGVLMEEYAEKKKDKMKYFAEKER